MSWRGYTWEFLITAISWILAIGALAFVAAYVAFDAIKSHRKERR